MIELEKENNYSPVTGELDSISICLVDNSSNQGPIVLSEIEITKQELKEMVK